MSDNNMNEKICNLVSQEVVSLKLKDEYNTVLLAHMICRKVKNAEEKMEQLIENAMNTSISEELIEQVIEHTTRNSISKKIKKHRIRNRMQLSKNKKIQQLEEELHKCEKLPEKLFNGWIISNTVKHYAEQIREEVGINL